MARLTAPATLPGTVPAPRTWRSSEPEGEGPGLKVLSPVSHRLFGLLCQETTARTRRPITWPQLGHAHRVSAAFNPDADPADRNGLDGALERLGLTCEDVLRLAREVGVGVKWTND